MTCFDKIRGSFKGVWSPSKGFYRARLKGFGVDIQVSMKMGGSFKGILWGSFKGAWSPLKEIYAAPLEGLEWGSFKGIL